VSQKLHNATAGNREEMFLGAILLAEAVSSNRAVLRLSAVSLGITIAMFSSWQTTTRLRCDNTLSAGTIGCSYSYSLNF
jgi:hypothetical protein